MRLDRIVAKNRIIDLKSKDFGNAIEELLRCCPLEDDADRKIRALKKVLRKREDAISSYLGNGIALPHARTRLKKNYILFHSKIISTIVSLESLVSSYLKANSKKFFKFFSYKIHFLHS